MKQRGLVQELGEQTLNSFESISNLTTMINASEAIAEAIGKIENIFSLVQNNFTRLDSEMNQLENDAVLIFGTTDGFKIPDLYSKKEALDHENIRRVFNHLTNLNSAILSMDFNLQSSLNILNEQKIIIDKEINRLKIRSLTIAAIVISAMFIIAIFTVMVLSNRLGKSIGKIVENIVTMKDGDLTVKFDDKYKDDIGLLCSDLNLFQKGLSDSIKNIQSISNKNISVQNDLFSAVKQTDETSTNIDRNANEIAGRIDALKDNIDVSYKAVDQVDRVFTTLNDQVAEQMAMVEESTASVTEMISSIESIARITESKTAAIDQLVRTSANGSERLNVTTGIINQINDKIDNISQMASIIKSIANQTNLLAMNAAIEAAHAGDSGRGFAVVADEIRKLAEASSKQSNEISSNLKEIVENIENAQASGSVTSLAYSEVDSEIIQFSQSLYEISTSITELKSGGEQILEAMTSLQDVSINVKNSSNDLSDASESMKSEMSSVKNITEEVHSKINDVSLGVREVSQSVNSITQLANSVGSVTENLNKEVSRFKTED
ncbi:methyl-accepting chemotaxis protein [Spirochaeta isovalerica]|uniref:Methyl-accepting chemotaxis protein n=1 Tax=Spirochaeta isovalerica TaxID=150 RepID=A0A841RFX1_9SPIO|nr:methyl-accepting chemotaxis protein [Spirochaeta isovalerica]MBB6482486.1 methyl-accepting chemotaxis protein [Spirochaeta isovalerica]